MGRTAPHRITPNDATLNVDTTAPNGSVLPEPPRGYVRLAGERGDDVDVLLNALIGVSIGFVASCARK
jgi:hypothetical protein